MEKTRVLLVDDDEEDFILTRDFLADVEGRPYELSWADSAAAAIKSTLADNPPDVCLIDYRLGPDDGIELTRRIIAGGYSGPVIMLTGQRDSQLDDQALASGAVDYLVKSSVTGDQLDRSIRYALTRKQFEREKLERIRAESRHRRADTENRLKSEFIAYISHELRTPLAAILGYADLVALHASEDSIVDHARAISRNGQYLNGLLNDILDLSKIEAGKLDLEIERIRTEHLIADVVSMIRMDVEKRGLQLHVELHDPLPEFLQTDARRVRQMLLNLLGNAIKYTEEGQIVFRALFDIEQPKKLTFEVEDTGIGISESQLQLIFEPFMQVDERHGPREGLGLGLAICRQLATRLRGSISAESTPGEGSTFRLTLDPNCDAKLLALDANSISTSGYISTAGESADPKVVLNGHVIVVDDAADIRTTMAQLLEALGASVTALDSGVALLEMARSAASLDEMADIVLLDMQMPELDGYETVRQLRILGFTGPVIAVTAAAMKGAREKCLAAGCDDYMTKPVATAQVVGRAARWLDRRKAGRTAPKILLVDDSTSALDALAALLNASGADTETASSAAECFDQVRRIIPDLVLMDFHLPDSRGDKLCRSLRALDELEDTRIVVMTGMSKDDLGKDALECFDAYLQKPASHQNLLRMCTKLGYRLSPPE